MASIIAFLIMHIFKCVCYAYGQYDKIRSAVFSFILLLAREKETERESPTREKKRKGKNAERHEKAIRDTECANAQVDKNTARSKLNGKNSKKNLLQATKIMFHCN